MTKRDRDNVTPLAPTERTIPRIRESYHPDWCAADGSRRSDLREPRRMRPTSTACNTTTGMFDRTIFGVCPQGWDYDHENWQPPREADGDVIRRRPKSVSLSQEAYRMTHDCAENGVGQLREILLESHFRGPLGSPCLYGTFSDVVWCYQKKVEVHIVSLYETILAYGRASLLDQSHRGSLEEAVLPVWCQSAENCETILRSGVFSARVTLPTVIDGLVVFQMIVE